MFKYILIGFVAQLIDGTIGMAYGISARTFLRLFVGTDTVVTSGIVHCAEIVTTFASTISHYRLKNFKKELIQKLLFTGMVGSFLGSLVVISFGMLFEVVINIYLVFMGILIIKKALYFEKNEKSEKKKIPLLGFIGGFIDATGGGWGPVVTSSLVSNGKDVQNTIGSVNIVEFFVTIAETTSFLLFVTNLKQYTNSVLGLIVGGVVAAPIAARLCKKVPVRLLLGVIGVILVFLNIYSIITLL